MEVKAIMTYFDLQENTFISEGTVRTVSPERGNVLIKAKVCEEVKSKKEVKSENKVAKKEVESDSVKK